MTKSLISLVACLLFATSAFAQEFTTETVQSREEFRSIDKDVQDLKKEVLDLNRDLFLLEEELLFPGGGGEIVPLNNRFQVRNGFLEICYASVFRHFPYALLEVFLLLEQHPEVRGVRADTIRAIRSQRHLIDNDFRDDIRCRSLFMEIIRQPEGVTHELRRMSSYGVLAAYLPVFESITGLMQYDLFHTYTVDEHTLFVVSNLRRFALSRFDHEFPLCSEVMQGIEKPEIAYLSGLFHDIAKGRGAEQGGSRPSTPEPAPGEEDP